MSNLNVHAKDFYIPKSSVQLSDPKEQAMHQLRVWGFSEKDQRLISTVVDEWYTNRTLNSVLQQWESIDTVPINSQKEILKILCYNVQGWRTRALEATELAYDVQASVCVFTEVGEEWDTCRLPHFNTFHQKGTNRNGGVCIAVGKHLKASRIDIDILNTVVVDIAGLSEPMRIIGIYWPNSQRRNLDDILPYVIEGSVITGDFNATVKEWNSPKTDKRGTQVKEWMEDNNLNYIPSTSHTSKRSRRSQPSKTE